MDQNHATSKAVSIPRRLPCDKCNLKFRSQFDLQNHQAFSCQNMWGAFADPRKVTGANEFEKEQREKYPGQPDKVYQLIEESNRRYSEPSHHHLHREHPAEGNARSHHARRNSGTVAVRRPHATRHPTNTSHRSAGRHRSNHSPGGGEDKDKKATRDA